MVARTRGSCAARQAIMAGVALTTTRVPSGRGAIIATAGHAHASRSIASRVASRWYSLLLPAWCTSSFTEQIHPTDFLYDLQSAGSLHVHMQGPTSYRDRCSS